MGDKISIEVLAERVANLQKEVYDLREKEVAPLWTWKTAYEKNASRVAGAIMAVTALATAISFGFEKAITKLLAIFTGHQ